MICFPNAKINIGLNIISKRNDGYHNISSLLYPIPFYDVLEFFPSEIYKLEVFGKELNIPAKENLVTKTWELLHKEYNIPPLEIKLLKHIPDGSGLGGGSADAAFLIKHVNEFFKLGLSNNKMEETALQIGSDCPFFIQNTAAIISGRGELINTTNFSLAGKYLLLVLPAIHTLTKEAFSKISFTKEGSAILELISQPAQSWANTLNNDFEWLLFNLHPQLAFIKQTLYQNGAIYASLTGSGSAIYGLYDNEPGKELNKITSPFFTLKL